MELTFNFLYVHYWNEFFSSWKLYFFPFLLRIHWELVMLYRICCCCKKSPYLKRSLAGRNWSFFVVLKIYLLCCTYGDVMKHSLILWKSIFKLKFHKKIAFFEKSYYTTEYNVRHSHLLYSKIVFYSWAPLQLNSNFRVFFSSSTRHMCPNHFE